MQYRPNQSHTEINLKYATGFTFLNLSYFSLTFLNAEVSSLFSHIGMFFFVASILLLVTSEAHGLNYSKFYENYIKDKVKNIIFKCLIVFNFLFVLSYSFINFSSIFKALDTQRGYIVYLIMFIYLFIVPIYLMYVKEENKVKKQFLEEMKKDTLQKEVN